MTNLILGTAQFGAGYGITNRTGRISDAELDNILRTAYPTIEIFDTAPEYGDAQDRLGSILPHRDRQYISKFGLPDDNGTRTSADGLYLRTLAALNTSRLYGLLFHKIADLRDARASDAWELLLEARNDGVIGRIGASVYDQEDLAIVNERFPEADLIQIPGNILDRRLLDHPTLHEMHDRGVEIHVRSVYLQGLLLAVPGTAPGQFLGLDVALTKLHDAASSAGLSAMEMALSFLKNHPVADAVLVGATSAQELESTLRAWTHLPEHQVSFEPPPLDDNLLDPRLWPPRGVLP